MRDVVRTDVFPLNVTVTLALFYLLCLIARVKCGCELSACGAENVETTARYLGDCFGGWWDRLLPANQHSLHLLAEAMPVRVRASLQSPRKPSQRPTNS